MGDNYWGDVRDIAEEIYAECECDIEANDAYDKVHEHVDGSGWLIYYNDHEKVLNETNNTPDGSEIKAMTADDATWEDMRGTAAYLAMTADVMDTLREVAEGAPECSECYQKLPLDVEEEICADCKVQCEECEDFFHPDEISGDSGRDLCEDCRNEIDETEKEAE